MKRLRLLAWPAAALGLAALLAFGIHYWTQVDTVWLEQRLAATVRAGGPYALRIDGGLRLSLLPAPSLQAERVVLAGLDGETGAAPFLSVERVRVDVRLRPLLAGELHIAAWALDGIRGGLRRRADGRLAVDGLAGTGATSPGTAL
ncbi:MAG: AsmA family protein, partial [Proteobacteria bacterium]|nr:AsmA family protein [Pseudomonadota bacterium]